MIITRTPFRVSLAGGGSDLPSFYSKHEGCVVSLTINKYMYVSIHPTFNKDLTIAKYNKTEIVENIDDLQHPIIRQLLQNYGINGVEISSSSDIPSGTGLSTSSAFTVGLIHALKAYSGKYASQERIAEEACHLEIDELGEPIGKQDQYGVAVGGIKFIRFLRDGHVEVEPVIIQPGIKRKLNENLVLFYTGITHAARDVLKEQGENMTKSIEKFNGTVRLTEIAEEMQRGISDGNIEVVGDMLHESWLIKRQLSSNVTNPQIDEWYARAMETGAKGGKLLGAGGGGFLLFYCNPEKQEDLRNALNLVEMPFSIETGGTKVVYIGDKTW